MLTSERIKRFALEKVKVDKVGIANIERFEHAPPDMHPKNIMPRAKSVIVLLKRVPRGTYRGIDEGTHWPSYTIFGYSGVAQMLGKSAYKLARFVESYGHEAVPVAPIATSREWGPRGPRPAPDRPRREVTLHFRIAATLAGLGEIGWSKVFLTEEFGPRQRIGILLTDAELDPDPIQVGRLCDQCKQCVAECPAGAVSQDRAVCIEVEGHKIEWNDLDLGKCKLTHFGLNRRTSPFLAKRFPGLYLPIQGQEVRWKEAWDLGWAMFPAIPTYKTLARHPIAICGARGCVIGCMKHMEEQGIVKNTFHAKKVFSDSKPWALPDRPAHVEHKGFVYDPDSDRDLMDTSSDEGK